MLVHSFSSVYTAIFLGLWTPFDDETTHRIDDDVSLGTALPDCHFDANYPPAYLVDLCLLAMTFYDNISSSRRYSPHSYQAASSQSLGRLRGRVRIAICAPKERPFESGQNQWKPYLLFRWFVTMLPMVWHLVSITHGSRFSAVFKKVLTRTKNPEKSLDQIK